MGSCIARAYVSVCTCVCVFLETVSFGMTTSEEVQATNTAVPRYGCHSSVRRKWLTGRLRAVHVRSVHELEVIEERAAYASSSAYTLSLTSTT